ncbi:glutamate receptor-interacting protein 1 [Plakobranchus ocellatus]|uniref:Glutamate receptor-interacting protein 1 n=1 Tax=Plakobranchus ocellatus TaxID=259542 RepID=A0AAV3YPX4_9GAST|nr:glutamate receptor-interacting protein 1 [Plakobranchus ocellatus]
MFHLCRSILLFQGYRRQYKGMRGRGEGMTEGHAGHTNNKRDKTLESSLCIGQTRAHRDLDNQLTLPPLVAHDNLFSSESLVCSGEQGLLYFSECSGK